MIEPQPQLNRQARVLVARDGGGRENRTPSAWASFGNVTHVEAARLCASDHGWQFATIETRDEGSDVTFQHSTARVIEYHVTALRQDDE